MRHLRHPRRPGQSAASLLCPVACALALSALLAACGSGDTGGPDAGASCTKSSQCHVGEGCIGGHCTPLPCGGCQPDEVCQDSGSCAPAQGAKCPSLGCPAGFKCNKNGVCSKPCILNADCNDSRLVCNSATGTCAQCLFDTECTTVAGKPRCDSSSGNCVACLQPIDCTTALGSGHYCDQATHTCGAGCKDNSDCNLSASERCEGATATAPGKCVQCTKAKEATDCASSAPACDANGRCVICSEDKYCGGGTPRCDLITQTCVACLPSHNATGEDCGYAFTQGQPLDPHDALTCDPVAKKCVNGCAGDTQCGCPIDPGTHLPTNCSRRHTGLHCDPALTSMPGVAGVTLGGCIECTANVHCKCKVKGVTTENTPECDAAWPSLGLLNGARCLKAASSGWGECQEGCDTNSDCPSGKLCSLTGVTAHTCVECSCAPGTTSADGTWCNDPIGTNPIGGCPQVGPSSYKICDAKTFACRLKRQNEVCDASVECGDTTKDNPTNPWFGQCIPGARFCVKSAHPYFPVGAPDTFCDAGKTHGRCGIACDDAQANTCNAGAGYTCPSGSSCETANAIDPSPSGQTVGKFCVSNNCKTP